MRLSIQRQCDGQSGEIICPDDARLELAVTVPGDRLHPIVDAWETAAAELGWRRINGPGEDHDLMVGSEAVVIPSCKAWVVCPACAAKMGVVCLRCHAHSCYCMGEQRFDARKPT